MVTTNTNIVLQIRNLAVAFGRDQKKQKVVSDVNIDIQAGEKVALVGESGSGKSVTALSILRLHDPQQSSYPSGQILFQGHDLLQIKERQLQNIRGKQIGMIFQEPMTSLNPVYTIGNQLTEVLITHHRLNQQTAREQAISLLHRTGIPEPEKRMDAYPHTLSGGQRQRVMISIALACKPELLIADEPTTALDVTIQAQIMELLNDLQRTLSMSILLISHDLNLVRSFADRVCVMQNGRLVETATVENLFTNPQHPYTQHLLDSQPVRLIPKNETPWLNTEPSKPGTELQNIPSKLLMAKSLCCYFAMKKGLFRRTISEIKAVDHVDIELAKGETIGIVGESGSGKTTLGLCLLRLQTSTGQIWFNGTRLDTLPRKLLRPKRKHFQVVFQDPYSSLSPRLTIDQIISEGLRLHYPHLSKLETHKKIVAILDEVGLKEEMLSRYPHEFSGGQRQRIAIARAVILEPELILLDEPTSALDVSVQKQILQLLRNIQEKKGISYLFISHDLKVVRAISHRILIMQSGRLIELEETEQLFDNPKHPYTKKLLHASLLLATTPA